MFGDFHYYWGLPRGRRVAHLMPLAFGRIFQGSVVRTGYRYGDERPRVVDVSTFGPFPTDAPFAWGYIRATWDAMTPGASPVWYRVAFGAGRTAAGPFPGVRAVVGRAH